MQTLRDTTYVISKQFPDRGGKVSDGGHTEAYLAGRWLRYYDRPDQITISPTLVHEGSAETYHLSGPWRASDPGASKMPVETEEEFQRRVKEDAFPYLIKAALITAGAQTERKQTTI